MISGAPSPASGNTATCKDSPSDAQIDAGELRQVDLQHQGDELKATFKLAHSIPQTGTFGTYLGVSNADGSKARQLGVKWLDGKLMSYFVFDVGKGNVVPGLPVDGRRGPEFRSTGVYEDVYVKTPDGWRIKSRTLNWDESR